MIRSTNYIIFFILFFESCSAPVRQEKEILKYADKKEDTVMTDAKWYYYGYALELMAHDRIGKKISPLQCNIEVLRTVRISDDTLNIFFYAYNKDSSNQCAFKPLDITGITIIRNNLYLPLYHQVVFESENDSIILKKMKAISLKLKDRVLYNNEFLVSSWLLTEASRR